MASRPPPPSSSGPPIPVLLLKTKSTPSDSYETLLKSDRDGFGFAPSFLPVLQHTFEEPGLDKLRAILRGRRIGASSGCDFGGLIFTSQRAVEAFARVVQEGQNDDPQQWPHLQHVPIYSVGQATTRAIRAALPPGHDDAPPQIFGSHTGNGDALARFILPHYASWYAPETDSDPGTDSSTHSHSHSRPLPPLLFPVGEQRRDVIPNMLMDASLPPHQRIPVVEEVVYATDTMASFPADLAAALDETRASPSRWIVVFSPTGCDALLRGLGVLDAATGRYLMGTRDGRTFVATIGPTTRSHLESVFGFEPDVCAETPTPDGVMRGILAFEERRRSGASA